MARMAPRGSECCAALTIGAACLEELYDRPAREPGVPLRQVPAGPWYRGRVAFVCRLDSAAVQCGGISTVSYIRRGDKMPPMRSKHASTARQAGSLRAAMGSSSETLARLSARFADSTSQSSSLQYSSVFFGSRRLEFKRGLGADIGLEHYLRIMASSTTERVGLEYWQITMRTLCKNSRSEGPTREGVALGSAYCAGTW